MYKICVFAGTTEGRELVEFLEDQPVSVMACVATEYGETLLHPAENLVISASRMTMEEMTGLFQKQQFHLVIDATHPYAAEVTENIAEACKRTDTEYLRLLREEDAAPDDAVFAADIAGAVEFLNGTEGNILLTTGSKELAAYTKIHKFCERVYARVLPMEESLQLCRLAGLQPGHILAMQGPFSQEMNVSMLHAVSARYMVTKESGKRGGFDQKIAAAREAGAKLVVIGRPPQREGICFSEVLNLLCDRFGFFVKPHISIVGIGPGNQESMTGEVLSAIHQADCIIGAKRMLEAADNGQPFFDAIAPDSISKIIHQNKQYRRFAVVMSGDVGFFSGTKKLLPFLEDCSVKILPGISSMVYLCARLGTSYENVVPISLHGRKHRIAADVCRYPRIFTLVGGENGIGKLCQELVEAGLETVQLSVGERLSYEDEKITTGTAGQLALQSFQTLSAALIENRNAKNIITPGLPDLVFQRGADSEGVVPMTKSEVRSVCLSKLQLCLNSICWDIGAGTGSVAIEMALQCGNGHVYAVEKKTAALNLLQENCQKFGLENLTVVSGTAPDICADLPAPSHVFIGGSSGNMKKILTLALEKNPDVRIVATAISLESVSELTECLKEFSFQQTEVVSISVSKDRKAGPYHLMIGQNPVYIFTMSRRSKTV